MKYNVDVLFPGFSGRLSNGRLNWGTTALIRGEGHNIMMDCGGMVVRSTLRDMLAAHGLKFEDIDTVLISHMHADHVYNVDYFPQAQFVMSRAEWEHAHDRIHKDYSVNEMAACLLRSYKLRLVERDGEVILPGITTLMTPGHTPGSMSYVIDKGNETWVLTGDAVKHRGELRNEVVQQTLNQEDSLNSIRKLKKLADRILPGHDGWLTISGDEVIPEGGNDVTLTFGQGITVNGQHSLTLTMQYEI